MGTYYLPSTVLDGKLAVNKENRSPLSGAYGPVGQERAGKATNKVSEVGSEAKGHTENAPGGRTEAGPGELVREGLGEEVTSNLSSQQREGASPETLRGLHIPSRGTRGGGPETARSLMLEEEKKGVVLEWGQQGGEPRQLASWWGGVGSTGRVLLARL